MKNIFRRFIICILTLALGSGGFPGLCLPSAVTRNEADSAVPAMIYSGPERIYAEEGTGTAGSGGNGSTAGSSGSAPGTHIELVKEVRTESVTVDAYLSMWHYSGSYWIVSSGSRNEKIYDKDIDRLEDALDTRSFYLDLKADLPETAAKAIDDGLFIGWDVAGASHKLSKIADPDSLDKDSAVIRGSGTSKSLSFRIKPRFNLTQSRFSDFVEGLDRDIQLLDAEFGWNVYSIFGNGLNAAEGEGRFYSGSTGHVRSPYIHPSQIEDNTGKFKAGQTILVAGQEKTSDGYAVGDGTFRSAGAVGYQFAYIFRVDLKYYEMVEKEVPDAGEDPGTGSGTGDPGTGPGSGDPSGGGEDSSSGSGITTGGGIEVPTGSGITDPGEDPQGPQDTVTMLKAVLNAPDTCYEGHSINAADGSRFEINGENYSAMRAYRNGLAEGSLGVSGGSGYRRTQLDPVTYRIKFSETGNFKLKLSVSAGDLKGTASQNVKVLSTPAVTANLGGSQKQNRKQVLQVVAAQNPAYPIRSLVIEIKDKATGETVRIEKVLTGAPENPAVCSDNIKCRALTDQGSDECYVITELAFLSKFGADRDFEYTVTAVDSRGKTAVQTAEFRVLADLAPAAAIGLEDLYYRGESSSTAWIEASDESTTDGDQVTREWFVDLAGNGSFVPAASVPGFRDLLFGTGGKVGFNKEGVGPFRVRLRVTDSWTEETLPEYVSASDRKSSEAVRSSHVDNMAPVLSLELRKAKTAQILLLADDKTAADALVPGIRTALRKEGISAEIFTEEVENRGQAREGVVRNMGQLPDMALLDMQEPGSALRYTHEILTSRFWGMNGGKAAGGLMDDQGSAVSDGSSLFVMNSTPMLSTTESNISYYTRTYPFTVRCFDIDRTRRVQDLEEKWSLTITEGVFRTSNSFSNARFVQDQEGMYLYLVSEGRTLVIDKARGSILGTVNMELGQANTVYSGNVYSIKPDGIWRISLADGSFARIWGGTVQTGYRLAAKTGGKLHFVMENGADLYRGVFSASGETVALQELSGGSASSPQTRGQCLTVDSRGRIVILYPDGSLKYYDAGDPAAHSIAASSNMEGSIGAKTAVLNSSGECRYVMAISSFTRTYKGVRTYWCRLYFYDLEKGRLTWIDKSKDGDVPFDDGIVVYASELAGSGRILAATGSLFENEVWSSISSTPTFTITVDTATGLEAYDSMVLTEGIRAGHGGGFSDGGMQLMRTNYKYGFVDQLCVISETESAEKARLECKNMNGQADYNYVIDISGLSAEDIAQKVVNGGENRMTLALKGNNSASKVTKNIRLKPGTTYFYEYDTDSAADILNVSSDLKRTVAKSQLGSEAWTASADHLEDFGDSFTDSFFTFDKEKMKNGRFEISCYEDHDRETYVETRDSINFTVPEGSIGVLSFYYDGSGAGMSSHSAEFLIGKGGSFKTWNNWSWYSELARKGRYYHTQALEPGTWTLQLRMRANAAEHNEVLALDDLRVTILKKSDSAISLSGIKDRRSSVSSGSDGMNHISGSFVSPLAIAGYEEYPITYYRADPNGAYSTETRTAAPSNPAWHQSKLEFSVPDGKKAAYVRIGTHSSGYYECDDDRWDSVTYSWYKGKGADGTNKYRNWSVGRVKNAGTTAVLFDEPGFEIYKANVAAGTTIETNCAHYYRGHTWADFAFVEMALVPRSCPALINAQNFAMNGTKMLIPNVTSSGESVLSFVSGSSEVRIANLRIWYVENGKRVYLDSSDFAAADDLSGWSRDRIEASVSAVPVAEEPEKPAKVYKAGESVSYNVYYYDYENDPSKASYWRYSFEPFSAEGGLSGSVSTGDVRSDAIYRFYEAGRYTVEHWQEDDASGRTGNHDYDKLSNVCTFVFFVQGSANPAEGDPAGGEGGSTGNVPWVEAIRTDPAEPEDGSTYKLKIAVSDRDGDRLNVRTEVYRDSEGAPVYTGNRTVNSGGSGAGYSTTGYPIITISDLPKAGSGPYTVVVIVSDKDGTDFGEYHFTVKAGSYLGAAVKHTPQWDENRRQYNEKMAGKSKGAGSGEFYSFRPDDLFWPGEELVLQAELGGDPLSVTAQMLEHPAYTAVLSRDSTLSPADPAHKMYSGLMWKQDMINVLGRGGRETVTVRFTARYTGGKVLTVDVPVIFDQQDGLYWQIHRYF